MPVSFSCALSEWKHYGSVEQLVTVGKNFYQASFVDQLSLDKLCHSKLGPLHPKAQGGLFDMEMGGCHYSLKCYQG